MNIHGGGYLLGALILLTATFGGVLGMAIGFHYAAPSACLSEPWLNRDNGC